MLPLDERRRADMRALRRFLLVGGANTLVTWVVFALLARIIDPRIAFTLVFAGGVAFTTFATRRYVFGAERSRRRSLAFAGWYLVVYVIGLTAVDLLDERTALSPTLLSLVVVAITAPLSFLGGRFLFRSSSDQTDAVPKDEARS